MNDQIQDIEEDEDQFNMLQYRCIRFKNGEIIIAGVHPTDLDHTNRHFIEVVTPLTLVESQITQEDGVYQAFTMKKWNPLALDDFFEVAADTIQTMFPIQTNFEESYFKRLDVLYGKEDSDEDDGAEEDQTPDVKPTKYLH